MPERETGFRAFVTRFRRSLRRLGRRGREDGHAPNETGDSEPRLCDEPILSPHSCDPSADTAANTALERAGSNKSSGHQEYNTSCYGELECGKGEEEDEDTDPPRWLIKDGKKRYRVGVMSKLIPDIFGVSEAAALGMLAHNCRVGKREPQPLLAPGVDAQLVTISKLLDSNSVKSAGRAVGKLRPWRMRKKVSGECRNTYPVMFTGSCMDAQIRIGVFNAPRAFLDELIGDHYFIPYLRLLPTEFTRAETLSLQIASEAAVFASMLWETRHMNNFGEGVNYYPGVVTSPTGTIPDFTGRGSEVLDSPYFSSTFVPGILVVIPQRDLSVDFIRLAVLLAMSAIETCVTAV